MTTTTLLLPLASTDHAEAMVNQIADAFKDQHVHLVGLHVRPPIFSGSTAVSRSSYGMYFAPDVTEEHQKQVDAKSKAVEDAFQAPNLPSNIVREYRTQKGDVLDEIARQSLYADALVLPLIRPEDADKDHHIKAGMTSYLLHNSCTPVLLLPLEGKIDPIFARPLLAWKESSEAGAATRSLLHMAPKEASIDVVTVQSRFSAEKMGSVSSVDLSSFVARRGFKVVDHTVISPSDQVGEAIGSKAIECNSTLIVAGAYTRRRWIEQLFGGVTENLFRQATYPVLFAR